EVSAGAWTQRHWGDVLFVAALLGCLAKFLCGIDRAMDLRSVDEPDYLGSGLLQSDHVVAFESLATTARLYQLWYFLLSRIQPDTVGLYYLNYAVLMAAMA